MRPIFRLQKSLNRSQRLFVIDFCDRFFGRIKADCKLIYNKKNRSQDFTTDFAHPLSIIKLVICWLFCDRFFGRKILICDRKIGRKFCDRKIGRKFLGKFSDLRPIIRSQNLRLKNRSQIFNSSSLLPNIFGRKIGRK